MQSTGHSSIHALSLMSTQGSAIVYVTKVSSISCQCGCQFLVGPAEKSLPVSDAATWTPVSVCPNLCDRPVKGAAWLQILAVAHTARLGAHLSDSTFPLLPAVCDSDHMRAEPVTPCGQGENSCPREDPRCRRALNCLAVA